MPQHIYMYQLLRNMYINKHECFTKATFGKIAKYIDLKIKKAFLLLKISVHVIKGGLFV